MWLISLSIVLMLQVLCTYFVVLAGYILLDISHDKKFKIIIIIIQGLLGFLHPSVLDVAYCFCVSPYLCPLSIQDAHCPHCSNLYTLGALSRHVNNVHPHVNLISHVSQATLFLQVSVPFVLHPGSIPFTSWGWLRI